MLLRTSSESFEVVRTLRERRRVTVEVALRLGLLDPARGEEESTVVVDDDDVMGEGGISRVNESLF